MWALADVGGKSPNIKASEHIDTLHAVAFK
jgi:hypothetical protein